MNKNIKNNMFKQCVRIIIAVVILLALSIFSSSKNNEKEIVVEGFEKASKISLEDKVLPKDGVEIPINWNDLGIKMIENGVIDESRFEEIYQSRGGLSEADKKLLYSDDNGKIKITRENSGLVLNLLWAFGLSNKNEILEKGPMTDQRYSGAGNFASTGGWTLSVGESMNHYSKHSFVNLTEEQQQRVENVSKGIYRPCCGNSTYFPDCNHGMAMLGLLELMASQDLSEEEMFKVALQVNSFWFPETYLILATYFDEKGISWDEVDPKLVLSSEYSSSAGYQKILKEMDPVSITSGGGCSV